MTVCKYQEVEQSVSGRSECFTLGIKSKRSVCPYVDVLAGDRTYRALLDSGSTRCLISMAVYRHLKAAGAITQEIESSMVCQTASLSPLPIQMEVWFKLKLEGFSWSWKFLVAENLGLSFILGADFFDKTGLVLDVHGGCCFFKFNRRTLIPFSGTNAGSHGVSEIDCENGQNKEDPLAHLPPDQREAIQEMCARYPDVLTPELGVTNLLEYEIRLTDNSPVRSHP